MKKIGSLFVSSLLMASVASAHHGFGRFDMNGEVELSGILTNLEFVNPHSYVYFDMTLPDGSIGHMGCEMRAATVLRRSGWSSEMFVKGLQVDIAGRPHRDDPTSCYVETIALGEAPALERYQQLSDAAADTDERPMRLPSGEPNIGGDWAQEQYLLATLPDGGMAGLVPRSMVAGIESGELDRADAPDTGWGARPVTLTPAGEAAAEILRNEPPELSPRIACRITSIIFDWVFDGPINRINQNGQTITIEYGRDLVRTIHMDGTLPADIAPSRGGYSTGHWEGDTLIVESIGFLPGRISGTVPHSDQLRVTERFTLQNDRLDRLALVREYVAEDAAYFTDQYTGTDTALLADAPFAVDQCKELAFEYTDGSEAPE